MYENRRLVQQLLVTFKRIETNERKAFKHLFIRNDLLKFTLNRNEDKRKKNVLLSSTQ